MPEKKYAGDGPRRLGEKLRMIREGAGLSMDQMAEAIGRSEPRRRNRVQEWESGGRVPPLSVVLQYARYAGVEMEALVDDSLDL